MKIIKLLDFLSNDLDIGKFLKNNPDITPEEVKNFFKNLKTEYQKKVENYFELYIDGASKGNPGKAGAGIAILKDGKEIFKEGIFLGTKTNNEAEYSALLHGLKKAKELGIKNLKIFSDSKLIVNQINGNYKIKNQRLKNFYTEIIKLLKNFNYEINYIPREKNKLADKLANTAIK